MSEVHPRPMLGVGTSRPILPTSSSDFALPSTSSSSTSSSAEIQYRFRRPSVLTPKPQYFSDSRLTSPLVSAFPITAPSSALEDEASTSNASSAHQRQLGRRQSSSGSRIIIDESELESDSDAQMLSGLNRSPSLISEDTSTPPLSMSQASSSSSLGPPVEIITSSTGPTTTGTGSTSTSSSSRSNSRSASPMKRDSTGLPSTPYKRDVHMDNMDLPPSLHLRRMTYPLKIPRIRNLLIEESRPEESEVKSEAAFQKLVAELPPIHPPRTPRGAGGGGMSGGGGGFFDRDDLGIGGDDARVPSDDDNDDDDYGAGGGGGGGGGGDGGDDWNSTFSWPVVPTRGDGYSGMHTPAGSVNGDDIAHSLGGGGSTSGVDSPGGAMMDVDAPSPSISNMPVPSSWRYTPPPTASAVRSNKRKHDDRYDPYPTSAKRRAVSPSVSYLRSGGPSSSRTLPVPISVPYASAAGPASAASSTASSPTVNTAMPYPVRPTAAAMGLTGSPGVLNSPTMRNAMLIGLASPILRPSTRFGRRGEDEEREREVDGAGDGVGSLSIG